MPKMIFTHTIADVSKWKAFDGERAANMSAFATNIESYVDPNGGNAVGVSMNVTDADGLVAFMQSAACETILKRHGVIKPISVLVAGA